MLSSKSPWRNLSEEFNGSPMFDIKCHIIQCFKCFIIYILRKKGQYFFYPPTYFVTPPQSHPWPFICSFTCTLFLGSHGHYPQFPLCPGLQVDMNQSVRDKKGLTSQWLALGKKQLRFPFTNQADIIPLYSLQHLHLPTCISDENQKAVACPSPV